MTDAAEQIIDDVMAEVTNGPQGAIDYTVGKLDSLSRQGCPRIAFVYGRITHDDAGNIGGNDGEIATEWQEFTLDIWTESVSDCRITKNNVLRALRSVTYGLRADECLRFGDFDWVSEQEAAYMNRGAALRGTFSVKLGIANDQAPLVTVQSESFEAKVNGEVVKPLGP